MPVPGKEGVAGAIGDSGAVPMKKMPLPALGMRRKFRTALLVVRRSLKVKGQPFPIYRNLVYLSITKFRPEFGLIHHRNGDGLS